MHNEYKNVSDLPEFKMTPVGKEQTPEATAALQVRFTELITSLTAVELTQYATVVLAESLNGLGAKLNDSFEKHYAPVMIKNEDQRRYMQAWRQLNQLETFFNNGATHRTRQEGFAWAVHASLMILAEKYKDDKHPPAAVSELLSHLPQEERKTAGLKN